MILGDFYPSRPRRAGAAFAAPARRVTLGDIDGLQGAMWSMPATQVTALLDQLPHLVGMTADQARLTLAIARPEHGQRPRAEGGVSIISIAGPILPTHSGLAHMMGLPTPGGIAAQLRQAMADPAIGAVLLDFHSRGGITEGITELAEEIHQARGRKTIVASLNFEAEGTAYWVAAACSEIAASPSSLAGAIGVVAMHTQLPNGEGGKGPKMTLIGNPPGKTDGHPYEALSLSARAHVQRRVNELYGMYTGDVARGRGTSAGAVRNGFGEGRTVAAREALRLRMVDRIATFDETLARLKGRKPGSSSGPAANISADMGYRRRRAQMVRLQHDDSRDRLLLAERDRAGLPAHMVAKADRALAWCRADLGLTESIGFAFFDTSYKPLTAGFFDCMQNEIWINAALMFGPAADLVGTVAHEARHAWQYKHWTDAQYRDGSRAEQDAKRYAEQVQPRLSY